MLTPKKAPKKSPKTIKKKCKQADFSPFASNPNVWFSFDPAVFAMYFPCPVFRVPFSVGSPVHRTAPRRAVLELEWLFSSLNGRFKFSLPR